MQTQDSEWITTVIGVEYTVSWKAFHGFIPRAKFDKKTVYEQTQIVFQRHFYIIICSWSKYYPLIQPCIFDLIKSAVGQFN